MSPHLEGVASTAISLENLDVRAEIGVREEEEMPFSLLFKIQDAVIWRDEVVVLDGAPPWVRVYDLEGRFLRSVVNQGQGPGEAGRPIALARATDGGFVLTEQRRITQMNHDGSPLRSLAPAELLVRWSGEVCGGEVWALARVMGSEEPPGLLMRLHEDGGGVLADTLLVLGPLREAPNSFHPPYVQTSSQGVLFYSEERDQHRLVQVDCAGELRPEILVDAPGLPERFDTPPEGSPAGVTIALYPPEPPYPAGVAQIANATLWALQYELNARGGGIDSVTVVQVIQSRNDAGNDDVSRVSFQGWFRILDSNPEAELLLLGLHEPVSRLLIVPAEAILDSGGALHP